MVPDGHLALWAASGQVYLVAGEHRCWNHRIVNVLHRVPKKGQRTTQMWLRQMMYAETREKAVELKGKFCAWCDKHGWDSAAAVLAEDRERLVAYYYPQARWEHLRTSTAKRFKKTENATAMLWRLLMLAESLFRKMHAPELVAKVAARVRYENGRPPGVGEVEERIAASMRSHTC
jgi:transposase-like protein